MIIWRRVMYYTKKLLLLTISLLFSNTTISAIQSDAQRHNPLTKKETSSKPQPPTRILRANPLTSPVITESNLSNQLLDKNAGQFYKEIIGDQYGTFKFSQCISDSITFSKQDDFEESEKNKIDIFIKIKNKINKEKNVEQNIFKSHLDYMLTIGQYYESTMQQYLITVFEMLSKSQYKMQVTKLEKGQKPIPEIVSPFSRELQGFIISTIQRAAPIASKIPAFRRDRKPDEASVYHVFLNALPSEKLNKLEKCMKPVQFHADGLKEFKDNLFKYIQHYQYKNKSEG